MKRYVIKFRQYGHDFFRTSPVLGDRKFAEVWGMNFANRAACYGVDFVQVEPESENA